MRGVTLLQLGEEEDAIEHSRPCLQSYPLEALGVQLRANRVWALKQDPAQASPEPSKVQVRAERRRFGQKSRGARSRADLRHGAGTIYKGQGKTLDRTYLYHTEHWRSAASYVALTRQRESAEVFVARETARDADQLARQMARGEVRSASLAWATRSERGAEQNRAAEREEQQRWLRDALTWNTRQGGNLDQVRAVLSPAARDFLDAMGDKIDRDMVRLTEAERAQVKLHGARELTEKEIWEGPVDAIYARKQVAEWTLEAFAQAKAAEQAREAERTPAPLLPACATRPGRGATASGAGWTSGACSRRSWRMVL